MSTTADNEQFEKKKMAAKTSTQHRFFNEEDDPGVVIGKQEDLITVRLSLNFNLIVLNNYACSHI